jgi:hypothetical protein
MTMPRAASFGICGTTIERMGDRMVEQKREINFEGLKAGWNTEGRLLRGDWEEASKQDQRRFINEVLLG